MQYFCLFTSIFNFHYCKESKQSFLPLIPLKCPRNFYCYVVMVWNAESEVSEVVLIL